MTGWLIVNEFLNTEKFIQLQELFLKAADKKGIKLVKYTNADFVLRCDNGDVISEAFNEESPQFVIFYDKDIRLAKALEARGLRLFNYSDAIEACDSKTKTALYVNEYNEAVRELGQEELVIRMPKTYTIPFTYENIGIKSKECDRFMRLIENELTYPMVIKECFSSFGMGVHLVNNREEVIKLICECANKECIIQEYIGSEGMSSKDIRLQMVGETCVAAMTRSNDHDFRANITNGGSMGDYEPREEDLTMAVSVMRALGLDFAGIDIMFDREGNPVFCEANSNAHFKNLYDLTGINAAENILDYAVNESAYGDTYDEWHFSLR